MTAAISQGEKQRDYRSAPECRSSARLRPLSQQAFAACAGFEPADLFDQAKKFSYHCPMEQTAVAEKSGGSIVFSTGIEPATGGFASTALPMSYEGTPASLPQRSKIISRRKPARDAPPPIGGGVGRSRTCLLPKEPKPYCREKWRARRDLHPPDSLKRRMLRYQSFELRNPKTGM